MLRGQTVCPARLGSTLRVQTLWLQRLWSTLGVQIVCAQIVRDRPGIVRNRPMDAPGCTSSSVSNSEPLRAPRPWHAGC